MSYSVTRWEGDLTATPDDIKEAFASSGLTPSQWSNGPGDRYGEHSHDYLKVLYCVRGGIIFHIEGEDVVLSPGDRLEVPSGTRHSATVGSDGVVCMEARAG